MSRAKDGGRDRVLGYDATGRNEMDERRVWTERVRQATERGLFVLTSQPIFDMAKGEATQHEILLRMRDDGVMVSNYVIDDRMSGCHFISPDSGSAN